jgi:photosystem II stability/assembly factor-like uncharacterized protein
MDLADACLVDLATHSRIDTVWTLDHDFLIIRWGRKRPFRLMPGIDRSRGKEAQTSLTVSFVIGEKEMPTLRLLVGTRKGAFILTSDAGRRRWDIAGPYFGGWEIYHMKGSPADPDRIYASQSNAWFGQIIQRSDDGGKTWFQPGTPAGEPLVGPDGLPRGESNKFVYDTSAATGKPLQTHQWYDGTQHPWEFKRVWHLEPSLTDPNTVYAGVEDAALFRSTDGGTTWHELAGLRDTQGSLWAPGAGGMGLHTILLDPSHPKRMFAAISAAGAFRTDDAGATWKPVTRGLKSQYMPDPTVEVGFCVHRIAQHRARPNVLFMQLHWDVMRTDDAGENWYEISGNLPTDFGFPIDVHAHEPDTVYVVPIKSDSEHYPPEGKLRVYRSRTGGNEWEALTNGLPQENCYVNVLREAMSVDTLDPCGIYFGTTGGQVYGSADGGDRWTAIVSHLPPVVSVEAQVLA